MVTQRVWTLPAACSLALLAACGVDTPPQNVTGQNATVQEATPRNATAQQATAQQSTAQNAAAQESTPRDAAPRDDILEAIADFNRRYLEAINTGDIEALAALTTDDHIMMAPNRPPLVGKAANIDAMTDAFERFDIDETWTPIETVVTGDWAYQRGTYTVSASPKAGGAPTRSAGSFLRIYRRQPDGEWRMIRDMFNSDEPPGGPAPESESESE